MHVRTFVVHRSHFGKMLFTDSINDSWVLLAGLEHRHCTLTIKPELLLMND